MTAAAKTRKRLETTFAAAVSHPIRSRCLVILAEREASPSEIARQLNLDVAKVGYHVTALAAVNLVEETRNRPVRGALEHFYRAVSLPIVDSDQEEAFSEAERRVVAETILSIYAANATHSLEVGTLLRRPDHILTRYSLNVDEEGWQEATAAHRELYERIFQIQEAAAERMRVGDEKPVRAISFQSFFEVPSAAK
jgi:predicted ArsR family transcriptional regulator